jgi:hypothetical protein
VLTKRCHDVNESLPGRGGPSGGHDITGRGTPELVSVIDDHAQGAREWTVTVRVGGSSRSRRLVASATCLS